MTSSLVSLVFTLTAPQAVTLPRHLGRASHALLLRLIGARDPALAAELHEGSGPRPFTCSGLVGGRGQGDSLLLGAGEEAWLRFTGLNGAVSGHLLALAQEPPNAVELDGVALRVAGATVDPAEHTWAGRGEYRDLLAVGDGAADGRARRVTLRFASPTTFRSQGVNMPVPLPYLVYGSLLGRWQAYSPVAVSGEFRRYAEEMVALARYRLRTRVVRTKAGGMQVGFVGEASFVALSADRYWVAVLRALTGYAFYAGVGALTAQGMGQARAEER